MFICTECLEEKFEPIIKVIHSYGSSCEVCGNAKHCWDIPSHALTRKDEKKEQPSIGYNGKKLYQIGCRKCNKGDFWQVFTDGESYIARCTCGHIVEINPKTLTDKPDVAARYG